MILQFLLLYPSPDRRLLYAVAGTGIAAPATDGTSGVESEAAAATFWC